MKVSPESGARRHGATRACKSSPDEPSLCKAETWRASAQSPVPLFPDHFFEWPIISPSTTTDWVNGEVPGADFSSIPVGFGIGATGPFVSLTSLLFVAARHWEERLLTRIGPSQSNRRGSAPFPRVR